MNIGEIPVVDQYYPTQSLGQLLIEAENEYKTGNVEKFESVDDFLRALST